MRSESKEMPELGSSNYSPGWPERVLHTTPAAASLLLNRLIFKRKVREGIEVIVELVQTSVFFALHHLFIGHLGSFFITFDTMKKTLLSS